MSFTVCSVATDNLAYSVSADLTKSEQAPLGRQKPRIFMDATDQRGLSVTIHSHNSPIEQESWTLRSSFLNPGGHVLKPNAGLTTLSLPKSFHLRTPSLVA